MNLLYKALICIVIIILYLLKLIHKSLFVFKFYSREKCSTNRNMKHFANNTTLINDTRGEFVS